MATSPPARWTLEQFTPWALRPRLALLQATARKCGGGGQWSGDLYVVSLNDTKAILTTNHIAEEYKPPASMSTKRKDMNKILTKKASSSPSITLKKSMGDHLLILRTPVTAVLPQTHPTKSPLGAARTRRRQTKTNQNLKKKYWQSPGQIP